MRGSPELSGHEAVTGAPRAFMNETKPLSGKREPPEPILHPYTGKRGEEPVRRDADSGFLSITRPRENEELHHDSNRHRNNRPLKNTAPPKIFEKSPAGPDGENVSPEAKTEPRRHTHTQVSMNRPGRRQPVKDDAHWDEPGWPSLPGEDSLDNASIHERACCWPMLPEDASWKRDPARQGFWEFRMELRKIERLRRLEKEQEGKSWNA